jgi:DNA-directed RNA polymerase alpha subunit
LAKLFFDEHLGGCTPMSPCVNCQIASLLKRKLDNTDFVQLRELTDQGERIRRAIERNATKDGAKEPEIKQVPDRTSIDELDLSVRSHSCLLNAQITTIEELCKKTPRELLHIPNFGRRSVNEVVAVLGRRDLKLKEE